MTATDNSLLIKIFTKPITYKRVITFEDIRDAVKDYRWEYIQWIN